MIMIVFMPKNSYNIERLGCDIMTKKTTYTPMMNHYLELKEKHKDAIIFYRLGDFYEMFFDDAKIVSSELDLVLTGRNAGAEEKVPMCGVPHHSANNYIQRLIQKGYKVAIVEQLEDASAAKGLVKRDVIKTITPGTVMDEVSDEKNTVYIASIHDFQLGLAVVLCEMTTGELRAQIIDKQVMAIQKVLLGNNVAEVVLPKNFDKKIVGMIDHMECITVSFVEQASPIMAYQPLLKHVKDERVYPAFWMLMKYLDETQRRSMEHLNCMEMIVEQEFLQMDYNTKQNLELIRPLKQSAKAQTLWSFLDKCKSSMGSRLLKKWIEYPLLDQTQIEQRLDAIEFLNENFITKDELKEHLSYVYDMERLSARVAYGSANPRDIQRLVTTLQHAPHIIEAFHGCTSFPFHQVDTCQALYEELKDAIVENPPLTLKEGGVFVDGYDAQLDQCREVGKHGKNWILAFEQQEKERTGIKSLKIGYNRVFGYYIEVTKANLDQIKEEFGYVRKQTLTNAERFVTQELKEQEEAILHAQERSIQMEIALFDALLQKVKAYLGKLHDLSNALCMIDALYALSEVSSENGYTRPSFHKEQRIYLEEARHPILDVMMKTKRYVSNTLHMEEGQDVLMITGPNMGGKSTFMRQTALLVIMAQIGCFVPARKAQMPLFDQIFTRIGASDDIMSGQSTFMVEMMEANHALQYATNRSLILFDEIGRGTSTFDGMALAQAMLEYLVQHKKGKTLFSTHYHELTAMADKLPSIRNVHVEVHEEDEKVTFLYRMMDGKADKSYGINVARLAHLPNEVLERAKQILQELEKQEVQVSIQESMPVKEHPVESKIVKMLKEADMNRMAPIEALQCLYELKELIK